MTTDPDKLHLVVRSPEDVAAFVPLALGFVPESELFFISAQGAEAYTEQSGNLKIGMIPLLSTEELIDLGRKELNGLEPDEEMKARYGLQ